MRRAHVNGVDLEYEISGAGEPVLLVSPVLADGFRPLATEPSLANRYQLVTYHRRGWAGSTHTPPPSSIADHAADAGALLDHLDIPRAHVVGHSSGAAVALQLALDRPDMVRTLALLELSLLAVPSASEFMKQVGPAFEAYGAGQHEKAVAIFMSAVSGLEWEACRDLLDAEVPGAVPQAIQDADTFFGIELPALGAWTFGAEQAARISQPVLSVLGTATQPLWIEVASVLRSWLPRVEECRIHDVGHLLHIQRAKPVAECLAGFVSRHLLVQPATYVHRATSRARGE